jgi:hypothetical protein
MPGGYLQVDGAMTASATDEAEHTLETSNIQKFNNGAWNAIDNPENLWGYFLPGYSESESVSGVIRQCQFESVQV